MGRPFAVLVVEPLEADRELIELVLRSQCPAATVSAVGDALDVADAIYTRTFDIVILSDALHWARLDDVVALVRRRHPATVVIVASGGGDGRRDVAAGGVVCDGFSFKTPQGLVRLPRLIERALEARPHERVGEPPARPEPHPSARDAARDVALLFAHDLREPMQQIERLARAAGARASDEGTTTLLRRIGQCAERAHTMLGSAVDYLKVDRHHHQPQQVDLTVCLQEAIDNLRPSIDESHAQIRAGRLPVVIGDHEPLVHVFQNLIANAIKFRGPEIPIVTISCEDRDRQHVLVFHDNGVGISAADGDRIFGVGSRLPGSAHIPGSGLGLALCRAIVERHGGQMSIDVSGELLGSKFVVTLPRVPDSVLLERETDA
jgi:signal transduction histidine kinase